MPSLEQDLNGEQLGEIEDKYDQERFKRYRAEGLGQFVDTTRSEKWKHFAADPWYDPSQPQRGRQDDPNGTHTKFLITGAGFGALTYAARLSEVGVSSEDITLVDIANGFGGAWYWNRYPGLMCDIESCSYMPLLEETGYIPKHRYAYGSELRQYAESIAQRYDLERNALFRSTAKSADWDENAAEWKVVIRRKLPDGNEHDITMRADFLIIASGILVHPKLPLIPGVESFQGHAFHTSRWDYHYTGGSQQHPELSNLKDKKVAIIGTGATAIQAVPELAKWAGKLYVFQRTASSVDTRGQRLIDVEEFKATCSHKGWQRERRENFAAFTTNAPDKPTVNLVDDAWTHFPSYSGLVGCPSIKNLPPDGTEAYVAQLHILDLPRQARIRARVDKLVTDKETAQGLKPWYPGWCKRPCFHDEYLPAFNKSNVQLVDTKGKGVEKITETGLAYDGQCYDVDLIVFSTGFEPWGAGSPAYCAGMTVTGRDGLSMDDKWKNNLGTFQGLFTRGFPNLVLPGTAQAAPAANQVHMIDTYATHVAKIISRAQEQVGERAKAIIEPTVEGEAEWVAKIMSAAHGLAAMVNCTPSYLTREAQLSALKSPEQQLALARHSPWTPGILDYIKEIEAWASQKGFPGLDIRPVKLSP